MPKGLFFSLPSVSVVRTLTPVMDELASAGYDIVYYNSGKYQPAGDHRFTFRAYPDSFDGFYSEKIDQHTTYFQLGELLMDIAYDLVDFLCREVDREQPDLILHSHLAVWGKLVARHCGLPAMTLYTTFILDKEIMLPFFRKINNGKAPGRDNITEAIGFYRKSQRLYERLGLKEKPDLWDVYINKGQLNVSYILDEFQPKKEMLGEEFHFVGHTGLHLNKMPVEKDLLYVAMGTILNKDLSFYKQCLDVLEQVPVPCLISVGSTVNIAELGPIPRHIRMAHFVDQPAVLARSMLFISRGGMASIHEAIGTLTPMIVIPVIPEQQLNAERVEELGIGIKLSAAELNKETLQTAIRQILANRESYTANLRALLKKASPAGPGERTLQILEDFFKDRTVLDMFVLQAAKVPDATAVICGELRLSYKELDQRSGRLAHHLKKKGVATGSIVPVLIKHHIDALTVMLGIMKAGGAYVPIDANYPAGRITTILEDMGCRFLLCFDNPENRHDQLHLPGNCEVTMVVDAMQENSSGSAVLPAPGDLAYVLYTSGSTGKPKGVMVEHAQIHRYIKDVYDRMGLKECGSYAMLGPFSADAGLTAVFAALCYGSSINIIEVQRFPDFKSIGDYFERYPVDCYKITPSLLDLFIQQEGVEKILPRKKLILGGEACPLPLARSIHSRLPPGCILYNHYGPTETTVGVTTYCFPAAAEKIPPVIPIGKPLAHVRAYILDESMQLVPEGAIGELYIAGSLVSRGYLNYPDITAQKFLTVNLLGKDRRVYRTGDQVRRLSDGNIEYIGRADHQVKINGNRIELKEIENHILSDITVRQCQVLSWETHGMGRYLAAYIVPENGFDKDRLTKVLKTQLPGYMIPSNWILLNEMPLTFNNKIDRKALPDPGKAQQRPSCPEEITGLGTQAVLSEIWCRLLGLEHIGETDDFFQSGGDSLLLMRMGYEVSRCLGLSIPPAKLFECLTIRQLAGHLDQIDHAGAEEAADVIFESRRVSLAQRNLFIQKKLFPSLAFPNSSLTFRIQGELDTHRLEKALKKIIAAHENLRTSYYSEKGTVYQRVATGFDFHLAVLDQPSAGIDKTIIQLTKPFDLNTVPLIRAFVIRRGNAGHYFHLDMPHINSDGESLKVIMEELEKLYNDDDYNPRCLQYEDFRRQVHTYQHSSQYVRDAGFWKEQLSGVKPMQLRPARDTRPAREPFTGHYHVSAVPESIRFGIESWLKGKDLSRFQFLLSAYFLLLYRLTDGEDPVVMLPVSNRSDSGSDTIVGLLSNMILLNPGMEGHPDLAGLLSHCRTVALRCMRHQRFPFENLGALLKEKGIDIRGLCQAFFGYHRNRSSYMLGASELSLYIPEKDKENLPLSVAVFDTPSALTLRWSSAANVFGKEKLEEIAGQYLETLQLLVSDPELAAFHLHQHI